jgi:hypothetical protein
MPVTIKFYIIVEKKPEHNQDIIWLKGVSSFEYSGYTLRQVTAEYSWELLEDGEYNGTSCCYEAPDDFKEGEANIVIMLDGHIATDEDLWVSVEEYWESFD